MSKKTQILIESLAKLYPHPESAFIVEFRGGTGWERESRADAIAMELWPSKGLELIGFEIKTSRQDWLKEIKNPLKCQPIKQFCDKWYLVVDDKNIVKRWDGDEIPVDWGFMCSDYMGRIITEKEAPKLNPLPIDRAFLASLMRIASNPFNQVTINGRAYKSV